MNYLQSIKVWCRNNLITVGKWGGISFVFGLVVTAFVFGFGGTLSLRAYVSDAIPANQSTLTYFINNTLKRFRLDKGVNISTAIPASPIKSPSQATDFSKFFSSSTVSSADITSFLKEAAVTGINLTILIITITAQVLKGLLGVIK